jgi:FecR protein
MKSTFSWIILVIAVFALTLSAAVVAGAQNREKFVITAKAGGVNATSGRVETRSTRGADWRLLGVTDDLKTGDTVRTGSDGRVEMLLNPGSYLRVAENSEFELTDNSLENLEVRLTRGTAIIEATGADETELAINITTPHAKMVIVRRGLYRVNVVPGDATELFVRKGRVLLANSHTKVKEGNKVIFSATTFSVAKLKKADKQKDNFESWSKERAQTVALANRRISLRDVNAYLSTFDNSWLYGFSARRSGLWYFNARFGCFTFLPFYFGWGSPYGSMYSNIFDCGCYGRGFRYGNGSPSIFTAPNNGPSSRPGSGGWPSASSGSHSGSNSGLTVPRAGPSPSSPAPSAPSRSDWPGRSLGKPDTSPDGGRQRVPPR